MFGLSLPMIKLAAIAIVVLALIGTVVGVKMRLDHLNSEVATLTAQNNTLTIANKTDEANIKASNDAVTALQTEEAQRSAAAAAAMQQVQQQSVAKQKQINQLLAQKATGNKAQDCNLLDDNFNAELGVQ
jgi:cytidylate kinase